MKNNRLYSFIVITIVYILATIASIVVYNTLSLDFWLKLLIADVVGTIEVFLFSLIFKNASVYDPYWSVQPIVILIALALTTNINATDVLLLIAVCFWGIRLTLNWAYTFKSLNHQDWRYTRYQNMTGKLYPIVNFFGIHLMPTIIVYLCTLPAAIVIVSNVAFKPWIIVFFVLALLSAAMQGVADIQMHKFRRNKTKGFIRNGLWKYSRHPNYLGEIMMWWSVGLFSVFALMDMPWLLIGALVNTCLFIFISIPLAEKNQANRKEGFAEYKKETRMLLPIKK